MRRPGAEPLPVALAPRDAPLLTDAITAGGGELVDPADAEALVWNDWLDAEALRLLLAESPRIGWVQLPSAGVERWMPLVNSYREQAWTSAKGAYSQPVAEHALALGLAGLRLLPERARVRSWGRAAGTRLHGARVTILGAGSITAALLPMLAPFDVDVTVVRRRVEPLEGARRVVGPDELRSVLPGAQLVVLALALTPDTAGIIAAPELECMDGEAWLVNVARGGHVVTDDLVASLESRAIGGAALDVTDPEPLPDGHPLWDLDNCLITPHAANTWNMAEPLLAERVRQNVERRRRDEPLLGLIDPDLGY